jgi:hypothetical protein
MNISGASYMAGKTARPAKKPVSFSGTNSLDGNATPPSTSSTPPASHLNRSPSSRISLPGLLGKILGGHSSRISVTSEPTPATPKQKVSSFPVSDPFKDSERQKRVNARNGIKPAIPEFSNEDLGIEAGDRRMRSQAERDHDKTVQKHFPGAIEDQQIRHDLKTRKIKLDDE